MFTLSYIEKSRSPSPHVKAKWCFDLFHAHGLASRPSRGGLRKPERFALVRPKYFQFVRINMFKEHGHLFSMINCIVTNTWGTKMSLMKPICFFLGQPWPLADVRLGDQSGGFFCTKHQLPARRTVKRVAGKAEDSQRLHLWNLFAD